MDLLSNIVQLLYTGFAEAVILLFILKILSKQAWLWKELFLLANSILLCTAVLNSIILFTQLFIAWHSQPPGEQAAFMWRITGPYWYTYWMMAFLPIAAPQVFWFRRVRKNPVASLVMIPLLFGGTLIMIVRLAVFRDARPAAWSYYLPGVAEYIIPLLAFGVLLAVLCFIRVRSGKVGSKKAIPNQ